ncbi:EamA family transporter [bacterium]|nr:EamA family transporter [bacterium]MBU1074019.1 EamA family transporter [bacterium]
MNGIYIVGCIAFTVLGQILIKYGTRQIQATDALIDYILNPYIATGLASAVVAALSWIKALRHFDLSYAYPFMSVSFLLVAILAVWVFGEPVKWNQWLGLGIVLVGLFIGSR